jgi:hypothetical protein
MLDRRPLSIVLLLLGFLLSPAEAQGARPVDAAQSVKNGQSCFAAVGRDSQYSRILQHMPVDRVAATRAQLTDPRHLRGNDAASLKSWLRAYGACFDTMRHQLSRSAPGLAAGVADAMEHLENAGQDLSARRSGWGVFANRLLDLKDDMRARMAIQAQSMGNGFSAVAPQCRMVLAPNLTAPSTRAVVAVAARSANESAAQYEARIDRLVPDRQIVAYIPRGARSFAYNADSQTLTIGNTSLPYDMLRAITVISGLGSGGMYQGVAVGTEPKAGAIGIVWDHRAVSLQPPGDLHIFLPAREQRAVAKRLLVQIAGRFSAPYVLKNSLLPGTRMSATSTSYSEAVVVVPVCAALFDPLTGKVYAAWNAAKAH